MTKKLAQMLARQQIAAMRGQYPPKETLTVNVESGVESCFLDCSDWHEGHYVGKPAVFFTTRFTLNGYTYDLQLAKVKQCK